MPGQPLKMTGHPWGGVIIFLLVVMQFETQRLILRDWRPTEDARHAMDIFGDARVMAWVEADSKDTSLRQVQGRLQQYAAQKVVQPGTESWAVVQKDIGRIIGHVALTLLPDLEEVRENHVIEEIPDGLSTRYVEMLWQFRPASWGFGYATEAARCIVQYAFEELQIPCLLAIAQPENKRAIALIERLGMTYDGFTTRLYGGESLCLYQLSSEAFSTSMADASDR